MNGLAAGMLGLLVIACGGCGGSVGSAGGLGASGVASDKRVDSLSDAEKALLCDWQNAMLGGYGGSVDCGNGDSIEADPSQADCVANWWTTCAATVGQGEACVNASSCANPIPAACTPFLTCQ